MFQWIINTLNLLNDNNLIICRIPGHSGITGNEIVDSLTRSKKLIDRSNIKITSSEFIAELFKYMFDSWHYFLY